MTHTGFQPCCNMGNTSGLARELGITFRPLLRRLCLKSLLARKELPISKPTTSDQRPLNPLNPLNPLSPGSCNASRVAPRGSPARAFPCPAATPKTSGPVLVRVSTYHQRIRPVSISPKNTSCWSFSQFRILEVFPIEAPELSHEPFPLWASDRPP